MLLITVSNNKNTFQGIFNCTFEIAIESILNHLAIKHNYVLKRVFTPLPDAAEPGLDNCVGMLIRESEDPHVAADSGWTFFVQVVEHDVNTVKLITNNLWKQPITGEIE